ncbi:hypothetical protein PAHAL_9G449300 [Panicum hallii]|uniref:Uncharacterized protein n=1 Tax=Panicum hallii TaxID=206008 RepID=A0A2T8I4Q2_9POAL|nr:hypothetical protein PAHAL_9G449300 [Panicum hallii]
MSRSSCLIMLPSPVNFKHLDKIHCQPAKHRGGVSSPRELLPVTKTDTFN